VLSHDDVLCYIQSWGKHCHYNAYMQQKHVHPHVYVNTAMSQEKVTGSLKLAVNVTALPA
jgi:hypothetical protein